MSRRRNTRYPHAFSKGQGVPLVGADRRWVGLDGPGESLPPAPAVKQSLAAGQGAVAYPVKLDPARWRYLKISPTIANLYRGNCGVAISCASCFNGRMYRNVGLPTHFRNQWHLSLMEIERLCKCGWCGARNARVYPYFGDEAGSLGLEGPPAERSGP